MTVERFRTNWGPRIFVWGLWLVSTYYLVVFVRTFGVDCPHFDEWENVPAITGVQTITLKWLWSQHSEHRIFVPRLIYVALAKLTHGDFRAGMVFNITCISLEAAALIEVARRMRGRTEYSDAFFPLLLQTWGQPENLYWSFQIQFICSAGLSVAFLALGAQRQRLRTPAALGLGLCGVTLPLVGGNGLAFAPAVSLAVLLAGWREWRRPGGKRWGLAVWALGAAAAALTAFYFVDYHRPSYHPPSHSPKATFEAACQFLAGGFGVAARQVWPESTLVLYAWAAALVGLFAYVFVARPSERDRAFRLLLVLGGGVSLAVGIGWARNALGSDIMFAPRYPTLAAPVWCAVYLSWEMLGRSQVRQLAQASLFLLVASLAEHNHDIGRASAQGHHDARAPIVEEIRAGVPLADVVSRHGAFTWPGDRDVLKARMRMLHDKGIGPFKDLKE